jgi:hypothetical protein
MLQTWFFLVQVNLKCLKFEDVFSVDIHARRASMNKYLEGFENPGSISDYLGINLVAVRRFGIQLLKGDRSYRS